MFTKTYPSLISGRYFSTIWCSLDPKVFPVIHKYLEPIQKYCNWLCTFGDGQVDSKFIPHISLRYLGFTDELDKKQIFDEKVKFEEAVSNAIKKVGSNEIVLNGVATWERKVNEKVVDARLSWKIEEKTILVQIHRELLRIPNYQLIENLESNNYNPHISLGQIKLVDDNYEKVLKHIDTPMNKISVKLSDYAINYATPEQREEVRLDIK